MDHDEIQPIGCSVEYGSPSGHALFASGVFLMLFFESSNGFSKAKYYIALICVMGMTVLICLDRLYLGLHTLDQVLYGFTLGVWVALYFHYCVRESITKHFGNILYSGENPSKKPDFKKLITMASLLLGCGLLL